jgi:hypothetical protein
MKYTFARRTVIAAAAAFLVAACGGGSDTTGSSPAAAQFERAVAASAGTAGTTGRMRALAVTRAGTPSRQITNAELFAFAQATFPSLFPGTPQSFQVPFEGQTYDVRAYSNGNYLGIANGTVYGLGPFTGGALQPFGAVQSYACDAVPRAAVVVAAR